MRIAWFHSHLLHAHSGGTRFVLDYAGALHTRHGHAVTILCDTAGDPARQRCREMGMDLVELDTCSTNAPRYWLTLWRRIARKKARLTSLLAGHDLVISSMFPMNWLTADVAMPRLQICYEPFAFFYDRVFLQNFRVHERAFFRLMARIYARHDQDATRHMSRVLTISHTNVPRLKATYGVDATPIYAGIDTVLFSRADDATIAAIRQRHPGQPLLIHGTDLTGIKGSYPLLEVLADLVPTHPAIRLLVTIYVDDPAGTAMFQERIAELGLGGHVDILGCLPREQLPAYYSAVDFVCQPSIRQPASWPLREAMLCGTPIIAGAESEEAVDFVNGIQVDIRDRTSAVAKFAAVFARREALTVDPSAAELRSHHSWEASVERLNHILEDVRSP